MVDELLPLTEAERIRFERRVDELERRVVAVETASGLVWDHFSLTDDDFTHKYGASMTDRLVLDTLKRVLATKEG